MNQFKKILITGGAGFIGGSLVRYLLKNTNCSICNLDKLGYASDISSINAMESAAKRHKFIKIDLIDKSSIEKIIKEFNPNLIIHLAAESHVDRSINSPIKFIESNILGTFNMVETATRYWEKLDSKNKRIFRFHHVSTDEVFGSLCENQVFSESSRYDPRSPYSASKASSDHIVRSWRHTFGLPVLTSFLPVFIRQISLIFLISYLEIKLSLI